MNAIRSLLIAAILLTATGPLSVVLAQGFEVTGKPITMTWPTKDWKGQHSFAGVFCLTYPNPSQALDLTEVMFNRNTLYLARASYNEDLAIYIATSVMPIGRTPAQEFAIVTEANRRNAQNAPTEILVSEHSGEFGAVAGLTIRNAVEGNASAPFPFVRRIARPNDGSLRSISVHRLFARGPDRIEVAGLRYFPSTVQGALEQEATAQLTGIVESVVKSLQTCTATMPVRSAR
jgi:hypothetical protein